MKNIFKLFVAFLAVFFTASLTGCVEEQLDSADVGLHIKVFFPTKVVAGQPITINGSGFSEATEIVFPSDVVVSDFEIISNDMIRVNAPAGISAEGGYVVVRTAEDDAESPLPLTLGKTVISGYSLQSGESIQGGQQMTIYGTDLEFITSIELIDADGNPLIIDHKDFYRKGTSFIVFTVPQNIYTGTFAGKVSTYDNQTFTMPEIAYEPAPTGYWETVKTIIWKNEDPAGNGAISWSGKYRFGLEGTDGNNECIAQIPAETWEKMKTGTFYMGYADNDPQIRVTTGWWSTTWTGNDIFPGNELITDNGDGTYALAVTLAGDPLLDLIDQQHLLFTGDRYTPLELYFLEEVWVEFGSGPEEVVMWENDGSTGETGWSGTYRFGLEGTDGNNECIAELPADYWEVIKTGTFYLQFQGSDWIDMKITTGWWSGDWSGGNIQSGDERFVDNGDGTYTIEIVLAGDPVADLVDQQHLLFTGGGYTPLKLYYME